MKKIVIWTENYSKPVTVTVKVSVSDKQPKLKVTPSSVQINTFLSDSQETSFEVTMQSGKNYIPVSLGNTMPEFVTCGDLFSEARVKDNKITLVLKDAADFTKTKTVKVKLDAKTLTLDMRAIGAETSTILRFDTKAGEIIYNDLPQVLTAKANNEKAPIVTLEKEDDMTYAVKAAYSSSMQKGNYKYDIVPELSDGTKLKKITLMVKVTTASKAATASLKAQKGSTIDLINRENTKYVYTVASTVKGTFIKDMILKKVELGSDEVDKELFDVVPATNANELNPVEVTVTVTPKESALKLNVNTKSVTLYRNIPGISAVYEVTPKTAGVEIEKMEYVPSNKVPEGAFEILETGLGTYQISIADKTKVVANKSYKLNFKVQAKGGAKTVTQSITIKVK